MAEPETRRDGQNMDECTQHLTMAKGVIGITGDLDEAEGNEDLKAALWAAEFHIDRAREAVDRLWNELRDARTALKCREPDEDTGMKESI